MSSGSQGGDGADGITPGGDAASGAGRGGDAASGASSSGALDRQRATELARSLTELFEAAHRTLAGSGQSSVVRAIGDHLGVPYDEAVLVSTELPVWQHVSAHRGAAAYLAQATPEAEWFGVAGGFGMQRQHNGLLGLLMHDAARGRDRLAPADYVTAATGPDTTEEVLAFGMVRTTGPAGDPAVLVLRTTQFHGPPAVTFEVLAADRQAAAGLIGRLTELTEQHDIIRGQVVSFGTAEHFGNELVSFLPRPALAPDEVILPDGVLSAIERHVVGSAERAQRLRDTGIHLKRGLLLHGPPGTGKTHTVRYLMGRLPAATVVVLSGTSLRFIEQAAALARRLAPTVVVIEDVDLVATDRSFSPTGNPLLFSLLDAMDGVAADADVTFVLTTNRAADLETALTQRPGRVDLAVEIPRPDAPARQKLFELYRGSAVLTADLAGAVAVTQGATASAIKELMRRAVLAAIEADPAGEPPVITDAVLEAVLAGYTSEREALSRALLGSGEGTSASAPLQGPAGPVPGLAPYPTASTGARMPRYYGGAPR